MLSSLVLLYTTLIILYVITVAEQGAYEGGEKYSETSQVNST